MTAAQQTTPMYPIQRSLDAILELHHACPVGGLDDDFGAFERDLHQRVMAFVRELLRQEIEEANVNVCAVEVDGVRLWWGLSSETTITTAAGDVRVPHTLYKNRRDPSARSVSVLELGLASSKGFTPHAAATIVEFLVT